ncbi:hypothetical protein AAE478_007923 [Parahypoxylon ruwenzoriense]
MNSLVETVAIEVQIAQTRCLGKRIACQQQSGRQQSSTEIERLQERLKELKEKQTSQRSPAQGVRGATIETPRATSPINLGDENSSRGGRSKRANGVIAITNEVGNDQIFTDHRGIRSYDNGPDPPSCPMAPFIRHMSQCLGNALNQPYPASRLEPVMPHLEHSLSTLPGGRPEFSQAKERNLLSLFWQGFHFLYWILDEDETRCYHDSLWDNASSAASPPNTRLPSALMDIMLALSMQFSSSFLLRDGPDSMRRTVNPRVMNSSLAGQWLYNRSRRLLLEEQQNPTLRSVQSSILSTLYLLNSGLLNLANTSLAITVRMAQILGLHEDPTSLESITKQGDVRRNVWRTLIALDGYLSITTGLPPLVSQPSLTYSLPVNFWKSNAAIFASDNGINDASDIWGCFQLYHTKLIMAIQSVHALFRSKKMELQRSNGRDIDSDPQSLESLAGCIAQKTRITREWVENVPPVLTIPRQGNNGKPFFFLDGPTLDLNPSVPLWLQRQRLVFEITYNHLNLLILRPFVYFKHHDSSTPTAQADSHGAVGLKHAISLTYIVNQAFTQGDTLTGWLFVFRCQWDATLYLLGFILANPTSPFVLEAHRSVATAIHTFTILEKYLCTARSALDIIRDVLNCISTLENLNGEMVPPGNPLPPLSRRNSLGSLVSPSPPLEFTDGSPASTNSEYYIVASDPAASSPQYSLLNSVLQSSFQYPGGGGAGPGLSDLSQPRNHQNLETFSSSNENEKRRSGSFNNLQGMLDSNDSMLINDDWQTFLPNFQPGLER